jgi:hypothetical protein
MFFESNKVVLISVFSALLAMSGAAADEWTTVSGHVPQIVSQLQSIGRLEPSRRLRLAIGLSSRDEQGLDTFIKELYDPASTNYHRYLSPDQFTARFGPTEKDYRALMVYAAASGLAITQQHSNRVVLDVEGSAANIEKAFQIDFYAYQHPTEARTFYAPDREPSVPSELPVAHIAGLNNYILPHPRLRHRADATAKATSKAGSAPGGQLWGNDFRNAYVPGTSLTGAGQSLGLVEFEGYYDIDITSYEDAIGISSSSRPQLVVVSLNGGATPRDGGDDGEECSLDIELSMAMAPGLSKIYVFEDGGFGENNGYFDDIFESMLSYPGILQFSCSWGGSFEADPNSETLFKQMAAQGQSFFDASGDSGAFFGPAEFPSDSPSITQVGGTTLKMGAPSHSWESEVVWALDSGPNVSARDATSSGGGISTYYKIPTWQGAIDMNANRGSGTMRNVPDVAANADNCYIFSDDGEQSGGWGGTSCAAPLWAAFTALMNQQAAASHLPRVGFLNPALYALASGDNYSTTFHDITSGNNTWIESPAQFYAVPGYDLCCGLGSMNGINLMNALIGTNEGSGSGTNALIEPGIYNGLFSTAVPDAQTSGMIRNLTVEKKGGYSGSLLIAGNSYPVTGVFGPSGEATNRIQRAASLGGPLTLDMVTKTTNSAATITGTVSGDEGAWVAGLTGEMAVKTSSSAEYTALVLPGTPPGYGYILITNHEGAVTLRGTLADGTAFSQEAALSGIADVPVYVSVRQGNEMLLGWISLEGNAPGGTLTWIRQASRASALYGDGFTNSVTVQGSPWNNPSPHTAAIDLSSGQLNISGGSLISKLTFNIAIGSNNTVVKLPGSVSNSLTGSINPKTGLLNITFGNGAGKATTTGTGAVLQNITNAGGFFLGETNAGAILLQP